MLPLEQVVFRRVDDALVPRWLGPEDHPWIEALLDELRRHEGQPLHAWRARAGEPLRAPAPERARRLVAAMLEALAGRAAAPSQPTPSELRSQLFVRAQSARDERSFDRHRLIGDVARDLGLAPEAIEDRLFADIPAERRLVLPEPFPDAHGLARRTNLAIAQGLVRSSAHLEIHLGSRSRAVLRQVLLGRLLFIARPDGEGVMLDVSGPLALFRHTTLYGRALGSLVPVLHGADRYTLLAHCRINGRSEKVRLSSGDPIVPADHLPKRFDSALEERFARDFAKHALDWDLVREPEPIEVDGTFIFPDFALVHRRDRRRWLLEIVGFWTEDYLRHKLDRLTRAKRRDLIVCVDDRLGGDPAALLALGDRLVPFRRKLDAAKVLAILEQATPSAEPPSRHREVLGLASLFIDFAGRRGPDDPIHQHLGALREGDEVLFRTRGDGLLVVDHTGLPIAALAGATRARWHTRLDLVRRVTVRDVVERTRAESGPTFRDKLRVDRWRVPLLEVEVASEPQPDSAMKAP